MTEYLFCTKAIRNRTQNCVFPDIPEIQTGFIIAGAGISQGMISEPIGLEDIAPTAAKILGIKFSAPDGKVITGLIKSK